MSAMEFSFYGGVLIGSSYVRVGHNSGALNNDAVWSFTAPAANITELDLVFTWSNGGAGTGWSGAYDYVFALSDSGAAGRTAAAGVNIAKQVINLSGASGTANVVFEGLTLTEGATYYVRANQNGNKYKTLKGFLKTATADCIYVAGNEPWKPHAKKLFLNSSIKKDGDDSTTDLFIICGEGGKAAKSANGKTWSNISTGITTNIYGANYVGGRYILCGAAGKLLVSEDGVEWETITLDTDYLGSAFYRDGLYLVCGGTDIFASADATAWEKVYDGGANLGVFAADAEKIICVGSAGYNYVSYDGYEWEKVPTGFESELMVGVARGKGVYAAVSYSGCIYISADGYAWKKACDGSTELVSIAYGAGKFLACGKEGKTLLSEDGEEWTVTVVNAAANWNTAVSDGKQFVLGGQLAASPYTAKLMLSSDGINFKTATVPFTNVISGSCFGLSLYHNELMNAALDEALKYKKIIKISGGAEGGIKPVYGEDYSLGDICDIRFGGVAARERIVKVNHIWEPGRITVTPVFGGDFLNVRQIIERSVKSK